MKKKCSKKKSRKTARQRQILGEKKHRRCCAEREPKYIFVHEDTKKRHVPKNMTQAVQNKAPRWKLMLERVLDAMIMAGITPENVRQVIEWLSSFRN